MKNTLLVCCMFFAVNSFSQSAFEENAHHATLGYGFPNLYKAIIKTNLENQQVIYNSYAGGTTGSSYAYTTEGLGPLFFKYEYGLTEHVGIGAVIGYFSTSIEQTYKYQDTYYNSQSGSYFVSNYTDISRLDIKSLSFGARFNYHFSKNKKIDPYIGFAAGYTSSSYSVSYKSNNPNSYVSSSLRISNPFPLYLGLTFGIRGYLTENIGLHAEFGLDKWAVIQGGLAFKFK